MDRVSERKPPLLKRLIAWAVLVCIRSEKSAPPLEPGLSAFEFANNLRAQFYKDRNYIRGRRRGWAFGAVVFRLTAVLLSGLATIMLGLADLSGLAAWGFALSALVTLVTALEPFFNFRAR